MIKRSLVIKYDTIQHLKGEVHSKESLPLIYLSLSHQSLSLFLWLFLSLCFSVSVSLSSNIFQQCISCILWIPWKFQSTYQISRMLMQIMHILMKILFGYILSKRNIMDTHSSDIPIYVLVHVHIVLEWKQWVNKFNAPSEADVKLTAIPCLQTDQC